MSYLISEIKGKIPHTEKEANIYAEGKNIIITGMNGCGKTAFLKELFETIKFITTPSNLQRKEQLLDSIKIHKEAISNRNIDSDKIKKYRQVLKSSQDNLYKEFDSKPIKISWKNSKEISEKTKDNVFLVSFFEATRQYSNERSRNNLPRNSLTEIINNGKKQQISQDFSTSFESYLVAFFEAGYLAAMMRNDSSEKERVDKWISKITDDLKFLFEDDSLKLLYNENERSFYIDQKEKKPFTLSTLSSGYSSILRIYTDLLMKVELHQINPEMLSGVVIIDEVDAHLHVSLQKKILSFLDKSYPNIQFIVSTHSPFVIQSVSNSTIFDLSKLEQLEDLSLYSYEAIIKGLLGVDTNSSKLKEKINELSRLTYKIDRNPIRANKLIDELSRIEKELDSKSKVILLMAKQALEDMGGE